MHTFQSYSKITLIPVSLLLNSFSRKKVVSAHCFLPVIARQD